MDDAEREKQVASHLSTRGYFLERARALQEQIAGAEAAGTTLAAKELRIQLLAAQSQIARRSSLIADLSTDAAEKVTAPALMAESRRLTAESESLKAEVDVERNAAAAGLGGLEPPPSEADIDAVLSGAQQALHDVKDLVSPAVNREERSKVALQARLEDALEKKNRELEVAQRSGDQAAIAELERDVAHIEVQLGALVEGDWGKVFRATKRAGDAEKRYAQLSPLQTPQARRLRQAVAKLDDQLMAKLAEIQRAPAKDKPELILDQMELEGKISLIMSELRALEGKPKASLKLKEVAARFAARYPAFKTVVRFLEEERDPSQSFVERIKELKTRYNLGREAEAITSQLEKKKSAIASAVGKGDTASAVQLAREAQGLKIAFLNAQAARLEAENRSAEAAELKSEAETISASAPDLVELAEESVSPPPEGWAEKIMDYFPRRRERKELLAAIAAAKEEEKTLTDGDIGHRMAFLGEDDPDKLSWEADLYVKRVLFSSSHNLPSLPVF